MRTTVLTLSVLLLAGCAGTRFYAHDRALEERFKKARDQFAEVTTGQASVWATMQSNLDAAARRESEALRRDAGNAGAATIAAIDGLTWQTVKTGSNAIVCQAAQALRELQTRIPSTIDALERLRAAIKEATAASGGQSQDTRAKAEDAKKAVPKPDKVDAKAVKDWFFRLECG